MATEKETLQARSEELGLETEGTIHQLKEWIAGAEADDAVDALPDVIDENPIPVPEASEALPEAPTPPPSAPKPIAAKPGEVRTYEVTSAFWLRTSSGSKLAARGGKVSLTDKQAKKYLKHNNIKLAA